MLRCEKCGVEDTTVTRVELTGYFSATLGDLCNQCKFELNLAVLIPRFTKASKLAYAEGREWIKNGPFSLAT